MVAINSQMSPFEGRHNQRTEREAACEKHYPSYLSPKELGQTKRATIMTQATQANEHD
jgi:hypothetical protein